MSQTNFVINLDFAVPTDRLFAAIAGADGPLAWWTVTCEVNEAIGGQSRFDFPGNGFFNVMKNLKREPSRLLEWECVAQHHHERTGFNDLQDWVGTHIRFEITDAGNGHSHRHFTHTGLIQLECVDICTSGWAFFLNESLRGYLEQGKGQPWREQVAA